MLQSDSQRCEYDVEDRSFPCVAALPGCSARLVRFACVVAIVIHRDEFLIFLDLACDMVNTIKQFHEVAVSVIMSDLSAALGLAGLLKSSVGGSYARR